MDMVMTMVTAVAATAIRAEMEMEAIGFGRIETHWLIYVLCAHVSVTSFGEVVTDSGEPFDDGFSCLNLANWF